MIIAGIDAGGTATKCIILNEQGQLLAQSQAGPANYQVVGLESGTAEIRQALESACVQAGVEEVDLLGIGLAGAGSEEDLGKIRGALLPLEQAQQCYLTNDAEIAVLGAHAGQPGLITIAGTGSIVYGLQPDGTTVRGGGWGPILGDEGSGFWIGLQALQAVIKAVENRGLQTGLTELVMAHLELANLRELVPLVYQQRLPRTEIAGLAPLVLEAMEKGDLVARRIVDQGLDELVLTVQAVYQMMEKAELAAGSEVSAANPERSEKSKTLEISGTGSSESFDNSESIKSAECSSSARSEQGQDLFSAMLKTAVVGGLFKNPMIYNLFKSKLLAAGGYQTIRPRFAPDYGAAFYAAQRAGIELRLPEEGSQ